MGQQYCISLRSILACISGSAAAVVVKPDTEDDGALSVLSHGSWRRFEMDKVFGPSSTQEQVSAICIQIKE